MKKLFGMIFVFTCFSLISTSMARWDLEVIDPNTSSGVPALLMDQTGAPHTAYTSGSEIRYAEKTTGNWMQYLVSSAGGESSIAIDDAGDLHLAWDYYNGSTFDLMYATNASGSWNAVALETTPGWHGTPIILVDGNSTLHIISLGDDGQPAIIHWENTGTGWTTETAVNQSYFEAFISATVDASGYCHVVYCPTMGTHLMYHTWEDGTGWNSEIVDNQESLMFEITTDESNFPHILYADESANEQAYIYKTSSGWTRESISTSFGQYRAALLLDTSNHPHAAWYSQFDNAIKYAVNRGTGWVTEDAVTGLMGTQGVAMALDFNLDPRITYNDNTATDQMYAVYSEDTVPASSTVSIAILLVLIGALLLIYRNH